MRTYYVYFMSSNSGTLYVGVTGNLEGRVRQHKEAKIDGFTKKYKCHKLVYFEEFENIEHAINRETQIKKYSRYKKEFLIRNMNPGWNDLALDWNKLGKEIPRDQSLGMTPL